MATATIGLLIGSVVIILLASGLWIGAALGISGTLAYYLYGGQRALGAVGYLTFNSLTSYDFAALSLFIFMATILSNCGVTKRIYAGSAALFARFPGGLLHANVFGCALFAAICGSTAATCAAMSTIALPELEKRNYPRPQSLGSLAASGTLGPMIPPSLGFILYGVLTETSIGKLFMAGIIPGIVLAALFMTYILIRSILCGDVPREERKSAAETAKDLFSVWPVFVLFILVLGSIYFGICTAVEAAALGCTGALLVAAFFRALNRNNLVMALKQGTNIAAMIFFVLLGGMILGHGLSNYGVPQYLVKLVTDASLSRYELLAVLTAFYVILGCFLDGAAILVITLPLVFPVINAVGIDRIWFGVVMVLFTEIAAITPPVGVNLFVMQGITKLPLEHIVRGVIPYIFLLLVLEILLIIFPGIATFLPSMMF